MYWRLWCEQRVYCSSELYLCTGMDWTRLSDRYCNSLALYNNKINLFINMMETGGSLKTSLKENNFCRRWRRLEHLVKMSAKVCFLLSWSLENSLFPSFWSQLRIAVFINIYLYILLCCMFLKQFALEAVDWIRGALLLRLVRVSKDGLDKTV